MVNVGDGERGSDGSQLSGIFFDRMNIMIRMCVCRRMGFENGYEK